MPRDIYHMDSIVLFAVLAYFDMKSTVLIHKEKAKESGQRFISSFRAEGPSFEFQNAEFLGFLHHSPGLCK